MNHHLKISAIIGTGLAACLLAGTAISAPHASLTRSMVIQAPPGEVWRIVGPFCAIGDWHPAIGSCAMDHNTRPTRTLVTCDGKATFVELQVARDDTAHSYSYSFTSSPVPVSGYVSTFSVKASGKHASIVTWRGDYTPNPGQESTAATALGGIYDSGLAAIRDRFAATSQAK